MTVSSFVFFVFAAIVREFACSRTIMTEIIIIIRNLYSALTPLGGYRGAGGTGR